MRMSRIVFLHLLCVPSLAAASQPHSITGAAGSSVTLPCDEGACQWSKAGLELGTDQELIDFPRMRMSECSLTISPLLPSDEGVYQCSVPGVAPVLLTVTAEPGQPHITQATRADVMQVHTGAEVTLECQSLGGKPAADITWTDSSGTALEEEESKIVPMQDGKTFKSISTLIFTPLTDTAITCSANNSVLPVPRTSVILIKHLKKPRVDLSVGSPTIRAGDSFTIACTSEAYPELVRYAWYVNGQKLFSERSSTLQIKNISKSYDKMEIRCRASNKVGSGEAARVLDVRYAPVIVTHPQDILAMPGHMVTFSCLAEASPAPSYVWLQARSREVLGFGPELKITTGNTDEEFVCKVFSEGFKEIESSAAALQVIRRPRIQFLDEGEMDGEHILHCAVESVAAKTKISWIVNDAPIDINDSSYETIYNEDGIFHHSFLVFKEDKKKNEEHACFVSNEAGTDYRASHATSGHNNTVIFAVLAIFLVIIVIIIIFFIHNRQKNSSAEKMENEKQLQQQAAETQPCLARSPWIERVLPSSGQSFNSCNTSSTFSRSFSLDQSRTGRTMGQ
jgi:hypothetical protein